MQKHAIADSVSNIPANMLSEAYEKLETLFGGGNVVIIGGRAVNLICEKSHRNTHDIDVVVRVNEDIGKLRKRMLDLGFYIESSNHNGLGRIELMLGEGAEKIAISIDLYYSRPIANAISIDDIFNNSIMIAKGNQAQFRFRVASPAMLLVLKAIAYYSDYSHNMEKHAIDISSLIALKEYGSVDRFIEKERKLLEEMFADIKLFKAKLSDAVAFAAALTEHKNEDYLHIMRSNRYTNKQLADNERYLLRQR